MSKSIYKHICISLTPEGCLPPNFELVQDETAPNQIRFAAGAMDGIGIFHMGHEQSEQSAEALLQLLKKAWSGKIVPKSRLLKLLREHNPAALMDDMLRRLQENHDGVNLRRMRLYACTLAQESGEPELVKLGIALLGLIRLDNDPALRQAIATLGLCEEFTLYAIVAASHWPDGNEIIFSIAQKVNGWGKIHAVERLEPATEEIRRWLLCHGCANQVMNAYLGLECAQKGDMIAVLRQGQMDDELFSGIGVIVDALLDEGPVDGISAYEHAQEALLRYLQLAGTHCKSLKQLWQILNVQDWLAESELPAKEELLLRCDEIARQEIWPGMIHDGLSGGDKQVFYYAAHVAAQLDLDIAAMLYEAVLRDPVGKYSYLSKLYPNPDYAAQLTALYERTLPLEQMAAGMGDYLFADTLHEEHMCLDFILTELRRYPGMGLPLLQTALNSPVVRERNGVCRVLEQWNAAAYAIPQVLYETLRSLANIEVNEDIKKKMMTLLQTLSA